MNAKEESGTQLLRVWIEDCMGRILKQTEIELPAQLLAELEVEDIEELEEVEQVRKELIDDYIAEYTADLMLGVSKLLPYGGEEGTL